MNYITLNILVKSEYGYNFEETMIPINDISRITKGSHVSTKNGWDRKTNVYLDNGKYGLVPIYGSVIHTKSGESFKVNESFDELEFVLNKTEHDIEREKQSEIAHRTRNAQKLFRWTSDGKGI